jgi:hypothetical protein
VFIEVAESGKTGKETTTLLSQYQLPEKVATRPRRPKVPLSQEKISSINFPFYINFLSFILSLQYSTDTSTGTANGCLALHIFGSWEVHSVWELIVDSHII